jgi:ubiquinone/menaquinone biosynthesis C-methylase UbiE
MNHWYEQSFGEDYLKVYKHRSSEAADQEVHQLFDWLPIKSGAEVLDLCCGMGRHSFAIHALGYDVTGIDLSSVLLREAKSLRDDRPIEFNQGDMRELPYEDESFDAVVNLFTSFGYFDHVEEDAKVLAQIHRVLRPDGIYVIDFLNPVYVRDHLVPHSTKEVDGETILEERWLEDSRVHKKITIQERVYFERVRLYSSDQMTDMLAHAGLQINGIMGDYSGKSYDAAKSKRMIFWGSRPRT